MAPCSLRIGVSASLLNCMSLSKITIKSLAGFSMLLYPAYPTRWFNSLTRVRAVCAMARFLALGALQEMNMVLNVINTETDPDFFRTHNFLSTGIDALITAFLSRSVFVPSTVTTFNWSLNSPIHRFEIFIWSARLFSLWNGISRIRSLGSFFFPSQTSKLRASDLLESDFKAFSWSDFEGSTTTIWPFSFSRSLAIVKFRSQPFRDSSIFSVFRWFRTQTVFDGNGGDRIKTWESLIGLACFMVLVFCFAVFA